MQPLQIHETKWYNVDVRKETQIWEVENPKKWDIVRSRSTELYNLFDWKIWLVCQDLSYAIVEQVKLHSDIEIPK